MFYRIFAVCVMCIYNVTNAFSLPWTRAIQRVDSLVYYNNFVVAEKEIDSMLLIASEENGYEHHKWQLLFMKALIIDNSFDHRSALPILLEVLEAAKKKKDDRLTCKVLTRIAFNFEKARNFDVSLSYLNQANALCLQRGLLELHSTILNRYALLHRFYGDKSSILTANQRQKLSMLSFKGSLDSAVYYCERAIQLAKQYNNEYDLNEAKLTLGILFAKNRLNEPKKSTSYFFETIPFWRKTRNYEYVALMYHNIGRNYYYDREFKFALSFNDSAYLYYDKMSVYYKFKLPEQRSDLMAALSNYDSAYHYLHIAYLGQQQNFDRTETSNTKRLEEQYQNGKKEIELKAKNHQMLLVGGILSIISIASILLYRKNREINKKNKIISNQLIELSKTLEQKQVLLSELQHRVKNNLQHVISILEIQKESVDFNNIDELIRGNQNRIHSMALLHKKLNIAEDVQSVDLNRYVAELATVVKESYDNHKKNVNLNFSCELTTISIEKALPIGLVIVELVSNSMKHAFKKRNIGIINIEIKSSAAGKYLYFADNGPGFDFDKINEKGLGLEIIRGLIDQLEGSFNVNSSNGFELTVLFK